MSRRLKTGDTVMILPPAIQTGQVGYIRPAEDVPLEQADGRRIIRVWVASVNAYYLLPADLLERIE